ncbi:hypothetical protein HDU82_009000 [Entophlyctis luteolus]|nr:hypothetical protein HDU82_009000 [Entophlyctis luteolus]KAJ3380243.1 hypothetical protein HDU84_006056 [Entophlyctis sp. JEL0112]
MSDSCSSTFSPTLGTKRSMKKRGRKPIKDMCDDRRIAQNRQAQRAFRERKEAYVHGLEAQIEEQSHQIAALLEENNALKDRIAEFHSGISTTQTSQLLQPQSNSMTARARTNWPLQQLSPPSLDSSPVNDFDSFGISGIDSGLQQQQDGYQPSFSSPVDTIFNTTTPYEVSTGLEQFAPAFGIWNSQQNLFDQSLRFGNGATNVEAYDKKNFVQFAL